MAGRFRFRLEVVERLRRQERDAQRREVANAQQAVRQVDQRIDNLTRELSDTVHRTRSAQGTDRLDMVSVRGHQHYRGFLQRRIFDSNEDMRERKTELDKRRAKLMEASKRLKVIEKLREKQWNRHVIQLRRREQAIMDETALQGYLRERVGAVEEVGT